jgi:signal transduction histidine kinase/ActR/RegA family two-component response regulator
MWRQVNIVQGTLRTRLFLLAVVGILPLTAVSGVGLWALQRQQRVQVERIGLEFARTLTTTVDAELRVTLAVLQSLSTAVALDQDDVAAFRVRAERIVDTRPNWAAVTLADPSGRPLVDTRARPGEALPPVAEKDSFEALVRSGSPVVGSLAPGLAGELLFAVRTPVIRNAQLRYVLSAIVKPEAIREVITRHHVPADWVISVFDSNGRRVARSRAHAENLGGYAAASLQALMARGGAEGIGQTFALEGDRIYTAYSRLESGWIVAPGIPAALVEGAVYRSVTLYGAGVLGSILIGTLAALWVARSINRPMRELRDSAQALGRHEAVGVPQTAIEEIRDVGDALAAAAEERRRSEAQRELLLQNEQDARTAAESANRAKDEFLAVLSHELRTPLNAVYGWARMLRGGQVQPERVERALEAIERNANAQVQLIDDLLDVSRVVAGKMRLDIRAVDLAPVVDSALDAVRPTAEAKGVRVASSLDPQAQVAGDPDRLRQVVWNLLINAVKFTSRGGRVQVHLQCASSRVELVVSDTGKGIGPDMLPFVFDRFRQGDSSPTRAHSGLGLGLALVKHLVELHGGVVAADSPGLGKGATFVVTLPLLGGDVAPEPVARRHTTAPPSAVRLDGLKVLVVDDDPDALELGSTILTGAAATVKTCSSASEAFEVLRQWRPDVLVSDIEMPGEDGYSLIRNVRALDGEEGGRTPAIALTAYGRAEDRVRALSAGYSMHVPKPVDPGELTTVIANVADRHG